MTQLSNYDTLISKLDQFIRKYYINKLIKGTLYTVGLVLALFVLFNVLEHYFYFGKGVRKALFGSFLITSIGALGFWVINPLIRFFNLGKTISHEQAANIIGDHFVDVKDKLLNILQLKKQASDSTNLALINASINQKTSEINPVPFRSAIDLSKNRKYLRYALPPLAALIILVFAAPSLIKDSTYRLINNDTEFKKADPYSFVIDQEDLSVLQYEDFQLNISIDGDILPNEAFIEIDNFQYRLQKDSPSSFSYLLRNVQKDTKFKIFSGKVTSDEETLKVLEKPNLVDFSVSLDYPGYTGRKDEIIDNIGDLVLPEGTKAKWNFNTLNAKEIRIKFASQSDIENADQKDVRNFSFSKRIRNNDLYKIYVSNDYLPEGDSLGYSLNVIKDQYPTISVEEFIDSTEKSMKYFVGRAGDDYGLSQLTFNYNVFSPTGNKKPLQTIKLDVTSKREAAYEYSFDIEELNLQPGENVSYYFEVKDNDAINGAKAAKTGIMTFKKPSIEDLKEIEDINEEAIKENIEESLKNMEKIRENYKKMREKLLQEKELDWQDKKDLEKLLEEQEKLQEKMQEAKEKFQQNLENQEEIKEQNEEILEKQEKLEQLFDEAVDPETQELMDKIQELMQELEKESALEMMEQMDMDNEQMEKEMDRLLELYKNLEVEKEVMDQIEELEKLAEEQEQLAEETEKNEKSSEELQKEQEKLNEKMGGSKREDGRNREEK